MLTAKQDNRLTAAENVLTALQSDAAPYQSDNGVKAIVAELQTQLAALLPLRQLVLRHKSKGPSRTKREKREQLATYTAEVAGDLHAYAAAQPDRTLQAIANVNYSGLMDLRGTALADTAQHLHTTATAHLTALADYGVTATRLQELQTALTAFGGVKNDPRQHISEAKAARIAVQGQFSALATLLEDRLYRSLRKYARSHPEFYQRIQAARIIIDRPGRQQGGSDEPPVKPE
ncbi:hypothetical protein [Hymenobacter sp. B81]|uniref:hypothetical protein n=1 Tax=Hymenobacter sp. B81 TaxID=3344878 RepID=UPI0037DCB488